MSRRYVLHDDRRNRTETLSPDRQGQAGRTACDNRLLVETVLCLPERFEDYRVVHLCHMRWSKKGVWQRVFGALAQEVDDKYAMIDLAIVRAHRHRPGHEKTACRPLIVAAEN